RAPRPAWRRQVLGTCPSARRTSGAHHSREWSSSDERRSRSFGRERSSCWLQTRLQRVHRAHSLRTRRSAPRTGPGTPGQALPEGTSPLIFVEPLRRGSWLLSPSFESTFTTTLGGREIWGIFSHMPQVG